jgi:hypothetical protein
MDPYLEAEASEHFMRDQLKYSPFMTPVLFGSKLPPQVGPPFRWVVREPPFQNGTNPFDFDMGATIEERELRLREASDAYVATLAIVKKPGPFLLLIHARSPPPPPAIGLLSFLVPRIGP